MNESPIEWTDETWNPVTGCTKVSQACKFCYAERLFPRPYPGRKFTDVRVHEDRLTQPLKMPKGRRIFVNSMSDLFHEDVPFEFIDKVFAVMSATNRHTYQVLTKRPQRMLEWFARLTPDPVFGMEGGPEEVTAWKVKLRGEPQHRPDRGGYDNCGLDWPLRNVWLGVSVEDQVTADDRIPLLLRAPAAVRFLSCEPLLGPIDLNVTPAPAGSRPLNGATMADLRGCLPRWQTYPSLAKLRDGVDWVIAGGESGPKARPINFKWAKSLRDQCTAARVPFFFKQWGEFKPLGYTSGAPGPDDDGSYVFDDPDPNWRPVVYRVGKKRAGRLMDGITWDQFPTSPHTPQQG